jgi:hypothetical protein
MSNAYQQIESTTQRRKKKRPDGTPKTVESVVREDVGVLCTVGVLACRLVSFELFKTRPQHSH